MNQEPRKISKKTFVTKIGKNKHKNIKAQHLNHPSTLDFGPDTIVYLKVSKDKDDYLHS